MKIYKEIKRLIYFGINKKLINEQDEIYVRNRILETLSLGEYEDVEVNKEDLDHPQEILDNILEFAFEKGLLIDNTVTYRDLMDTKIMDCLVPLPSEVTKKFYEDYEQSPEIATQNYYKIAKDSNYVRTERTNKNLCWKSNTDFGELEITINLSKPEKDPKAIAAAKRVKSSTYPRCLLCKENEGYAGSIHHPARQNHRIIPLELCGEKWFFQFSPYIYYNEHSIIFKDTHEPMRITQITFQRLLEFVDQFPHYFIGSNADLPIVGGSILSHDHFQSGKHIFPMEVAPILQEFNIQGFEDVEMGIVKWPLSVIRIRSEKRERLVKVGGIILDRWRAYSDKSVDILCKTQDESHNTITPIARYKDNKFELDLVLRNNRTSDEHPLGIFHPHKDLHHIKKENIGLIEVMGLAVLPARLIEEMALLKECFLGKKDIQECEALEQHNIWFNYLKEKYQHVNIDFDEVLKLEVGKIFKRILMDAGVFKQDVKGLEAFHRFIHSL
ncbi:UDPglucose--hexose-1-phosphate uridylyltransferase [Anaerovirgula multivorans]|uniref:Galactose-1-phosphate uridylyltransferase n=1 Tax=Anaerovirgula multivorans TaxID=312168 RepID=A0A239C121_9FIRM|nr:UDP-glucose--hexose-1-phosphate uridylyltransferase [Anaerovirgula multivorans]SNS13629.1 UDPglucose--hexose-1-phosphate uridylyltransferase [Anaerovirgula multivorans]